MRASRLALAAALGTAGLSLAQDKPQGEIALVLGVGEKTSLCPCPVSGLVCDDASLVKLLDDPDGQSLEGVKPGSTLCSLLGPNRIRRTYRVTVTDRGAGKKK